MKAAATGGRVAKIAITAILAVWVAVTIVGMLPDDHQVWDYGCFIASGDAFNHGADPYNYAYARDYNVRHGLQMVSGESVNLNPPLLLPVFGALARLDPWQSFLVWQRANLAAFLVSLGLLLWRGQPPVLLVLGCLASAAVNYSFSLGQLYPFLLLFAAVATLLLDEQTPGTAREIAAGVSLGLLAAIKPNFLLWPAMLGVAGKRVPAVTAAIVFGLAHGVTFVCLGPDVYGSWATAVSAKLVSAGSPANLSVLQAFCATMGLARGGANALIVVLALVALVWARKATTPRILDAGVLLPLAILPISWVGYGMMMFATLILRHEALTAFAYVAIAMLIVPDYVVCNLDGVRGIWTGFYYPLAMGLLVADLAIRARRP